MCDKGYFIKTPDNRNICVPLRNYMSDETFPYYRLRHKDYYPEFKRVDSTFFISTSYPYPPNKANVLFYEDHFILRNINTGKWLGMEDLGTVSQMVTFTDKKPVHVQFIPIKISRSYVENYVLIQNGAYVAINIPHTSFILRKENFNDEVKWLMRATTYNGPSNTFQIHCYPPKKVGENLNYNDKFYFTYFGRLLQYNEDMKLLEVTNNNFEDALGDGKNVLFDLIPQVEVRYCEGGKCKSINLSQTQRNGESATYKNFPVSRSKNCWGKCESGGSSNWRLYVLIAILVIAIILVWKTRKK